MQSVSLDASQPDSPLEQRTAALFQQSRTAMHQRADRLFAGLMILQWLAGIAAAVWISPRTWIGATSSIHWHVWAAIFLGGTITSLPVLLAWKRPGHVLTRQVIAVAQMLTSALLIHLTGGRIETHFHIFGSLAFLAFYRDWRVLVTATVVVVVDHMARGLFWPQSVFGVLASSSWRWLEHAAWVVFEDTFLCISIQHALADMRNAALRQASLESVNAGIELQVAARTAELTAAHQKLQANEARLRLILETVPECVKLMAADGTLLDMNPAGLAMIEVARVEQVIGKSVYNLLPPEHQPPFRALNAAVFRGESGTLEYELIGQQGTHRWLETRTCPLRDEAGRITAQLAVTRDTTERKLAEVALRQSEERFAEAFEYASIGMALVAPDGRWLKVNAALCELVGYTSAELLGLTFQDLTHPDDLKTDLGFMHAVLAGELQTYQMEKRYLHKLGHVIVVTLSVSLVRDARGRPLHFISQIQDITARKQAEAKTLASLKEISDLKAALDAAAIVDVTDARGMITSVNDKFCALSKYAREELIGQNHKLVNSGRHRGAFFQELWQTIGAGRIWKGEVCNRAKDGTIFWVDTTIVPFLDATGTPFQHIVIRTDITARKQAEENLEKVHRDLLQTSRQAGMAEVATSVLHNVGNVLNSVNVSATLVAEKIKKSKSGNVTKVATLLRDHDQDLAAFLTTDSRGKQLPGFMSLLAEHLATEQSAVLVELDSLQKNIEHIKEVVAMQQGYAKFSGVTETVNPVELMEDTLRMNAASLQRHELRVVREYSTVPSIEVDKHKLLQVLVNLVRNAKHACEDSRIADKQITLRITGAADRVRISVCDNGVGIPPENLTRIFSHGFTTKKDGHGFGLHSGALAVREMGGTLAVHSDGLGRGATFTVELPLHLRGKTP